MRFTNETISNEIIKRIMSCLIKLVKLRLSHGINYYEIISAPSIKTMFNLLLKEHHRIGNGKKKLRLT